MRSPWERPREGETPPPTYWLRPGDSAPVLEALIPVPPAPPASAGPEPCARPTELTAWQHILAIMVALGGGVLGVLGAAVQEVQAGAFVFVAAGIIEEALKPSGIYILLVRWPHLLVDRYYTACLTALSGLVFGLIEAAVYILVYFPEGGPGFVTYRLTVPLLMHTAASFIFGLGIKRELVDWANGLAPFPKDSKRYMLTAMALHAGFNLAVVVLALAGLLPFEEK